jgi:acetoin utilization protein AcuB
MLVRDCMTSHPVLVGPNCSLPEARQLMVENEIGHLPVVDDDKRLLGLITRSHFAMSLDNIDSLDVWEISSKLTDLKVKNVMIKKRQVITVTTDTTVEFAAGILTKNSISSLPVVKDDKVVGMITTIDLLGSYQVMLGLPTPGIRVTVRMPAQKKHYSELAKLVSAIGEKDWGVMGIGTFPTPNQPDFYDAVVKIPGVTIEAVKELIATIPDQDIVDIREVG